MGEDNYNSINSDTYSFQLANAGFVVNNPIAGSQWKWVNFGFAYNHLNDYNQIVSVKGYNNQSSLLDYQVDLLNGNQSLANNNAY